jgi:small GTP-binding protein
VQLDILDTAGQDEYGTMRDSYMRSSEGFILVYSITSADSFDNLDKFLVEIQRAKDQDHVPMVLVGNKCDLEEARAVSLEEGRAKAEKFKAIHLETSAKNRININEIFENVVREVWRERDGGGDEADDEKNGKKKKKKKRGCQIL